MTESRFQMWRTVVAIAREDNNVTPSEMDFIEQYLAKLELSDGQKAQLRSEAVAGPSAKELASGISDDRDRGIVVHFARLLAAADGNISPDEKKIIDLLGMEAMVDEDLVMIKKTNEAIERVQDENLKNSPKFYLTRILEFFFGDSLYD